MRAAALLSLLSAAALPGLSALRHSKDVSQGLNPSLAAVALSEEGYDKAETDKVPNIRQFEELWTRRYSMETHLNEPMTPSIQLVMGLFTVPQDKAFRDVVRKTWLQQAGVCLWRYRPKEGCSVYVAFVMGTNGTGEVKGKNAQVARISSEEDESAHMEKGVLTLDVVENMNGGKSNAWFQTALKKFPWATHIGKMDMDTYPFFHKLLYRMEENSRCVTDISQYEFIGRPHHNMGGAFSSTCPRNQCVAQYTSGQDDKSFVAALDGPWNYMTGEIYIMSRPLVEKVRWEKTKQENEDVATSKRVAAAAEEHGFCVVPRRLDSWYHKTNECDPVFANNYTALEGL